MNLNQITLEVTDMERAIAFYEKIGPVLIVSTHPRYARLECPDGGTTLSLHPGSFVSTPASLYFEVEDVRARYAELVAAGITFESEPVKQSWLWEEAWFRDPDGNLVEIANAP